ncbi:MAG: radical SAM protein [Chloroflexia bacterium]
METLEVLLERAWAVRQARFAPRLGVDDPRDTRAISLTGGSCALQCAHCGGVYLRSMIPVHGLAPDDARLQGATSLLISGGCDAGGRLPFGPHVATVRALRPGRRLNWHLGLVGEDDLPALEGLVDVVSFDLVGEELTLREVYGLDIPLETYHTSYRRLRRRFPVIPHITIGLHGGKLLGERAAVRWLQQEGAEAVVFLVLIPTPGTRFASCAPPPPEEVARLLAEARLALPDTLLILGCMRPGGAYRRELDRLAVRAGVNRVVKPHPAALEEARRAGLQLDRSSECCAFSLPGLQAPPPVLRVSAGTEVALGLRRTRVDVLPTTAYLMLGNRDCAMACGFCAQARGSRARSDALSRVLWPLHSTEEVLQALGQAPYPLQRICLQVTVHRGALAEAASVVRALRRETPLPVSVAIRPPDADGVGDLLRAGADAVGLGLDACNEEVFRRVKGPGWVAMLRLVETSCRRYGDRVRVHLIMGLGETEQDACRMMQRVYDWGGTVGLFAFTPLARTALGDVPPPDLASYRRIQLARYLIHHRIARAEAFRFDPTGRLTDVGPLALDALLADGKAFQTSGCPGCNRPFYNERPGGPLYNFPRPLTRDEIAAASAMLELPHVFRCSQDGCPGPIVEQEGDG